ncbi:Uncharacterised protein [Mycobacteroides abscessus subsp. bolletii]|uniref:hypothetical protein n=1 Tax=Mycobacteroides abscessus TaxID=36809 RepID=UPI0009A79265|nr:hypothetical protein [Mycobacteroides abscessus]SKY53485.1 Uncharacterised protein [Mycobacteroides abscessus subsp. bolletii]
MTSQRDPGFAELIRRYAEWRQIYTRVGRPVGDEPVWENNRLNLRYGYPYPDWTGHVIEPTPSGGYQILRVTTERRNEPAEYPTAYFSHLDDAGKYIIWKTAVGARQALNLPSLSQEWRAAGLDPRVSQVSLDTYVSKFELKSDPTRYFIMYRAGGIQPENRLLPLTYDELDSVLQQGMPQSVTVG